MKCFSLVFIHYTFPHVISFPHVLNRTVSYFPSGKVKKKKPSFIFALFLCISLKYSLSLLDADPNHMHAALLVLIHTPSTLKAHYHLTIYLQHNKQSSFYVIVATCECVILLRILHFLFIFVLCLCLRR